jgi:hypothetical protein
MIVFRRIGMLIDLSGWLRFPAIFLFEELLLACQFSFFAEKVIFTIYNL